MMFRPHLRSYWLLREEKLDFLKDAGLERLTNHTRVSCLSTMHRQVALNEFTGSETQLPEVVREKCWWG